MEDKDEFVVAGCRASLGGSSIRVEPLTDIADAQAITDDYVAALRQRVGGVTQLLTVEKFRQLPPRQITVRRSHRRDRANRRAAIANARRDIVASRHPRLSQCHDYFQSAVDDPEHALIHLYKLVESVDDELGGEQQAKIRLDAAEQINVLKRLANGRSSLSRDPRHAPKTPGTVTALTQEELSQGLQAGDFILRKFEQTW